MKEEWRSINGYEGYYEVSNIGRVKRLSGYVRHKSGKPKRQDEKIISQSYGKDIYRHVTLYKEGNKRTILTHRLVALAFIPNPENKKCVNHIDGDRSNNNVSNLEWCTYSQNMQHAVHTLNRHPNIIGLNNHKKGNITDPIRYNGKNVYGETLKTLLKSFMNGDVITPINLSNIERQRFKSNIWELRKRFGIEIISERFDGKIRIRKYYLKKSAN